MRDKPQDSRDPSQRTTSSEYGDALGDVLKDQVRRTELRKKPGPKSGRRRLHPAVSPVLALISVWLWAFPPAALLPVPPTIPPANQEAGLRIEMFMQASNIIQYLEENGRLPADLSEVGESAVAVRYIPLSGNVFQLTGQTGDIQVDFTSTDPLDELLADSKAIVSGLAPSAPQGAPAI